MLAYVPVRFDLYRAVRPALRWTLQCLVGFADRGGRCFPSVRKLSQVSGVSKSSVSRHLAALERAGLLTRYRRAGGVYTYAIDSRFLPAGRVVSHKRERAVPQARREEHPIKNADGLLDDSARWSARMRSWNRSRFWLPFWGPRPSEAGCWAPPAAEISAPAATDPPP